MFGLISFHRWLCVALYGSCLQKNIQLMLEFLKAPCLVPHFSFYILMTFLMMLFVILLSVLMILLSTPSVIRHLIYCNNQMAAELESDLRDTMYWVRKWFADFNAGKAQPALLEQFNNIGAIDVKMDGFVLEKNHFLRCWWCLSIFKMDAVVGSYIIFIAKTVHGTIIQTGITCKKILLQNSVEFGIALM